jgi:hypothetical protein
MEEANGRLKQYCSFVHLERKSQIVAAAGCVLSNQSGPWIGQILQQDVGFAIQHAVALLDDGVSDGLGAVTFPAPRWTYEQGIFALSDPVCCRQFEDHVAIHPGVELEGEVVQALFETRRMPVSDFRRTMRFSEISIS